MSESDIDMDRCLLGIDDEKACVPEITWTNCSKQMPLDDAEIMRMSHEEALRELILVHKLDNRMKVIRAVSDNGLLGLR